MFHLSLDTEHRKPDWWSLTTILIRLSLQSPRPAAEFELDWNAFPHPFLYAEQLRNVEDKWREEIEMLVRWLAKDGTAHSTDSEPATLLCLRARTIFEFLMALTINGPNENRVSIIPFPSMPIEQVFSWFMIDWWNINGTILAGRSQILEKIEEEFKQRIKRA